jgi:hypothetical protein
MYTHITNQYKRSEDLEIYEMDYDNNGHLQEICDVKQPVIFEFEPVLPQVFANANLENLSNNYGQEILNVKDTKDYAKDDSVDSIHITCSNARKLFLNDASSHYYTENNGEFLEETGLFEKLQKVDEYLKPRFTVNTKYDYITGSAKTCTPLRYHYDYRHYYVVTSGKITVKMTPWKSCKYLHPIRDYDNYEFRSTFNTWEKPTSEMEKVRFLEYVVDKGNVLYIPPYWWYSIEFQKNSSLTSMRYRTYMNNAAIVPHICMYFLQNQNVKRVIVKKATTSSEKNTTEINDIVYVEDAGEGTTSIDQLESNAI